MAKKETTALIGEGDIAAIPLTEEEKAMVAAAEEAQKVKPELKRYEHDKVLPGTAGAMAGEFNAYNEQGDVVRMGNFSRPLIPIAVWGRGNAVRFSSSVRMGRKGDFTFIEKTHYDIFMMTNRMVRVTDKSKTFVVYVPLENVTYFEVDPDAPYERGFQAIVRKSAAAEEEAEGSASSDGGNQLS